VGPSRARVGEGVCVELPRWVRRGEGVSPSLQGEGSAPSPENFLHFHVEMAHFVGYFGCKF